MSDHEDDGPERFKHLPEPIRLSQLSTTYAVLPASSYLGFVAPMPFGDGGVHGDGD
jgi:hypothetical protein